MITIFSAPKPFVDVHISMIQANAIQSWKALGEGVEVLLIGEEPGLLEAASELSVPLLPIRSRAQSGAPLINELFQAAREASNFSIMCYVNTDIILLDDFLPSVSLVVDRFPEFLIVGNRWDLDVQKSIVIQSRWTQEIRSMVSARGRRHSPMGSDYFVFNRTQFADIPAFTLGRSGWDNWMMYKARLEGIPLLDASAAITAVHQEHDYAHLPDGKPHYRHPESMQNIELAGGYEAMFRLRDANWILYQQTIRRKHCSEWEWPRKLEADFIAAFGTGFMARLTRMMFHPVAALSYIRSKISKSFQKSTESPQDPEKTA